jgi:CTP synthase (UTP-ammonia lyase)
MSRVRARIALVGDENRAYPSHREINAVRSMLGEGVEANWSLHGQERLIRPVAGTRFSRLVHDEPFVGMHYCNYGPGGEELRRLVEGGMLIEATADDAEAEVIELPQNQFFVLTLFQPQIGALEHKPVHPLLREFVRCAREHALAG